MAQKSRRKRKFYELQFPVAGLDKSKAIQQQAPYTTPYVLNVWPYDQLEGRSRGGSRPGLKKAYATDLSSPINVLVVCTTIDSEDGSLTNHVVAASNKVVYILENNAFVTFEGALAREYDTDDELLCEDGTNVILLESSSSNLGGYVENEGDYIQHAILDQKIYFADYSSVKASGTDGVVADDVLTAPTYDGSWNTLDIAPIGDVAILTTQAGSDVSSGVYIISSLTKDQINLNTEPGDGACTYMILTGVKVMDPKNKTLNLLEPSRGTVPHGCRLVAAYRDRLVLGGHPSYPHMWYMSRQGDPTDWLYSDDAADLGRPMYGDGTGQQETRMPLKAIIPRQDSYLIFASENSMEVMRGDPAAGGEMYTISESVGVVDKSAWCEGPDGEIFFLSRDGLYVIDAGAVSNPRSVSREKMPRELRDVNTMQQRAFLEYDSYNRGILIIVSDWPLGLQTEGQDIFWFDLTTKSFWPMTLGNADMIARSVEVQPADDSVNTRILWGCLDGYVRYLDEDTKNDDGSAFSSYVAYGPVKMGSGNRQGMVQEVVVTLDESSEAATCTVIAASSAEDAVSVTTNSASYTLAAGRNGSWYPRLSGGFFTVRIVGTASKYWASESIYVEVRELGRQRVE